MIEEYIANNQFQDALDLLNDMDDEMTRYQRLVCLYGLGEYQMAKAEGMLAKAKASNTYYDVVSIYVATLKELEEFEEAINIMVEELSMPYIPYEYEAIFNAAHDELLLAKREANEGMERHNNAFSLDDMENILMKDLPNEDLLYMAIEQMEGINIRRLLPAIRDFLKDENKPSFAKSLLIELMIDQEIDEEMTLVKKGIEYGINPSYAPLVLNQEVGGTILNLLSEGIEDDNPSLYSLCEQFLNFYLYLVYPKYIDDYDYRPIAAAIHYHIASMQYIDIELDDIEYLYNCDKEEILEKANRILLKKGCVEKEFFDSVKNRERMSSTEIGNGIAIPHGSDKYVRETAIVLITLEEPILWRDGMVSVVLYTAVSFEQKDTMKKLLKDLYHLISSEDFIERIQKAATVEEILGVFYGKGL